MVRDVVCGMGVEEDDPETFVHESGGVTYYFCSDGCLHLFMSNPLEYISTKGDTAMARELVCGMEVDEKNPPFTSVYNGMTYYFCSSTCKREFEQDPEKFIKKIM